MSVQEQLQPGEEVLYQAHLSRISLIPWIAALVLVLAAGAIVWSQADHVAALAVSGVLGLALLAVILGKLAIFRSHEYVLTNRRIIKQTGILTVRSMDAQLDKVNNVEHRQSLWGRIFDIGDVEVDTASETGTTHFVNISRPVAFKRAILAACDQYRAARSGGAAAYVAQPPGAERMRQLKALLDEGLISEPEYEAKRRKLLEEI
ncbi:MAG TPA: PH domain-containing protein [Thermoanaerobaculia bacterium]